MVKDWMEVDWMEVWKTPAYHEQKKKDIDFILDYFKDNPPKNILDIGCGLAWESRALHKEYGTKLWLLDGDVDSSPDHDDVKNVGWRGDANNMSFYNKLDELDAALQETGLTDYTLVDCNNIVIPDDVKFDLVYSAISCGFHYEANTYKDLILKHSHEDTKILFDMRVKKNGMAQDGVEIIKAVHKGQRHKKCLIKFI